MSLNTQRDLYRCNLCGAHGNSVTLYAAVKGISNAESYRTLTDGSRLYDMPVQPVPKTAQQPIAPIEARHAVYEEMLSYLTLLPAHRKNLRERGLSEERIEANGYRSMPDTEESRRLLAKLVGRSHALIGIPGFYIRDGQWTLAGANGFLIPVRDIDGRIQGMKIRLDDAQHPNRKYRWLSSRHFQDGTRSYSWIHVTGDRSWKRAFITEGPLKGDVASYLAGDALFVCTGGVNAIAGLRDTIEALGVYEVVEAMDMDQMTNPQVRNGVLTMRGEIRKIPGIRYTKYTWNAAYKGVDDYLLSRAAAQ